MRRLLVAGLAVAVLMALAHFVIQCQQNNLSASGKSFPLRFFYKQKTFPNKWEGFFGSNR